jgi:hypothetical protein
MPQPERRGTLSFDLMDSELQVISAPGSTWTNQSINQTIYYWTEPIHGMKNVGYII